MYFPDDPGTNLNGGTLAGLSELTDRELFERSITAIKAALDLNPVGGYVAGSPARHALALAFLSVPMGFAGQLHHELTVGQTPLAKLFIYRLATPTMLQMLEILKTRIVVNELRAMRTLEDVWKKQCEVLRQLDQAVDILCRTAGEDSDRCQKARFEALGARTNARDNGNLCQ